MVVQDSRMMTSKGGIMKTRGLRCMVVETDQVLKTKESNISVSRVGLRRGGGREVGEDRGKRGWVLLFLFPL